MPTLYVNIEFGLINEDISEERQRKRLHDLVMRTLNIKTDSNQTLTTEFVEQGPVVGKVRVECPLRRF